MMSFLCKHLRYKDVNQNGRLYLRRFYLTPLWFPIRIFLHYLAASDADRHEHDHPWRFTSLVLWPPKGGYVEEFYCHDDRRTYFARKVGLQGPFLKTRRWLSWAFNRAEHIHRVSLLRPTWTLVFAGKARRQWGFWVPSELGRKWVQWNEYLNKTDATPWPEDVV